MACGYVVITSISYKVLQVVVAFLWSYFEMGLHMIRIHFVYMFKYQTMQFKQKSAIQTSLPAVSSFSCFRRWWNGG